MLEFARVKQDKSKNTLLVGPNMYISSIVHTLGKEVLTNECRRHWAPASFATYG